MERLVEVWMHPAQVERLKGGVTCSEARLVERGDGTYELGLRVTKVEARCWNWPVSIEAGDGEDLLRERAA